MKPTIKHLPSIQFDLMLVFLASLAGSIDVMSYFRLQVFTANMTGNTILLGLSIGQGKVASSLHSLAALGGFMLGVFAGALIVEHTKKVWSYYITVSMAIESFIIGILVVIWLLDRSPLHDSLLYPSIALSAIAMGIQSATVRHLNIPGIVTTFITGTITSIGMSAVDGLRNGFTKKVRDGLPRVPVIRNLEQRIEMQAAVFLVYGFTAVFTGWLEFRGERLLPLLPLMLVLCVLALVIRFNKHPYFKMKKKVYTNP